MVTLTRFGIREWGVSLLLALALTVLMVFLIKRLPELNVLWGILIALTWVFWVCLAMFFRNPPRELPQDGKLLVSPADGVIKDIEIVDFNQPPFEGKAVRIGIFLSVFNVHVNRTPARLEVRSKVYRPGRYLDARNDACAKENEAMTISGSASVGEVTFPLGIRQISGAIARRIVCPVEPGDTLERGEVYGMIKFGSRTELYLPVDAVSVTARVGDIVKGGETVLAELK